MIQITVADHWSVMLKLKLIITAQILLRQVLQFRMWSLVSSTIFYRCTENILV